MKVQAVARWAFLLAIGLVVLTTSYALACGPFEGDPGQCRAPGARTPVPRPTPTAVPTAAPLAIPAAPVPSGLNPDSAIEPTGDWRMIQPGATTWFKASDGGMSLQIWLDANGQQGLEMAIYAPDQTDLYGSPIGRGAFNKFEQHDLFWTGRSLARGTWWAVVTNKSTIPISYSLDYKRVISRVADRCAACHGYGITFEGCEDKAGGNWCNSLEEEYKH